VVAEHPKHFLAEVGILKVRAAFPRAEYKMYPNACERLRHGGDPFLRNNKKNDWPVGPTEPAWGHHRPQGVALGWNNRRPFGAEKRNVLGETQTNFFCDKLKRNPLGEAQAKPATVILTQTRVSVWGRWL
jgi:hypothetical protein